MSALCSAVSHGGVLWSLLALCTAFRAVRFSGCAACLRACLARSFSGCACRYRVLRAAARTLSSSGRAALYTALHALHSCLWYAPFFTNSVIGFSVLHTRQTLVSVIGIWSCLLGTATIIAQVFVLWGLLSLEGPGPQYSVPGDHHRSHLVRVGWVLSPQSHEQPQGAASLPSRVSLGT